MFLYYCRESGRVDKFEYGFRNLIDFSVLVYKINTPCVSIDLSVVCFIITRCQLSRYLGQNRMSVHQQCLSV